MRIGRQRLWILAGAGMAGALAISLSPDGDGITAVDKFHLTAPIEPITRLMISESGGTVQEIKVDAGEAVHAGQLMIRLVAPQWAAQGREIEATVRALEGALAQRTVLANLPSQARTLVQESQPGVVRVEEQYIRALAEFDRASTQTQQAAKIRLEAAAEARLRVHQQMNNAVPSNIEDLQRLLASARGRLAELRKLQDQTEVVASVSGHVDILDLHVGDSVLPGHPVALLVLSGEYLSEMAVPPSVAARLVAGTPLKCNLTDGDTIDARVESISRRAIPVVLRESREIAEETILRIHIFSEPKIEPGSSADCQLP